MEGRAWENLAEGGAEEEPPTEKAKTQVGQAGEPGRQGNVGKECG